MPVKPVLDAPLAVWAASIREAPFQREIIDHMHRTAWKVAHFRTARIQRKNGAVYYATPVQADGKGFPDLVAIRGPRLLVVEVKSQRGEPDSDQELWLALWRSVPGAEVHVWRPMDWDEICRVLE